MNHVSFFIEFWGKTTEFRVIPKPFFHLLNMLPSQREDLSWREYASQDALISLFCTSKNIMISSKIGSSAHFWTGGNLCSKDHFHRTYEQSELF